MHSTRETDKGQNKAHAHTHTKARKKKAFSSVAAFFYGDCMHTKGKGWQQLSGSTIILFNHVR
jgi:hypothetical protein